MKINPKSLFGGLFYGILKHCFLLVTSPEYRNIVLYVGKYGGMKRFCETSVKLEGQLLTVPDMASFISQYEEIYWNRIYDVSIKSPRILDLGANIGMSVIWAHKNFEKPKIVAVEADPKIFSYLEKNTKHLDGVELLHCAVWDKKEELVFSSEGADGGRVDSEGDKSVVVQAVDVKSIIEEYGPFDFIKMDIEGAEARVVPACRGLVAKTKFFFCEYHSKEGDKQYLAEILEFFTDEGFRFHIQPINTSKQPFLMRNINAGYDMQLNIFAWKDC